MTKDEAREKSKAECLRLLRQGKTPYQCRKHCKDKFGYTVSSSWIYARYHEIKGDAPEPPVRKPKKKSSSGKAMQVARPAVADLGKPRLPSTHDIDAVLTALVLSMRAHGIEWVTVHADGRVQQSIVAQRSLTIP